MQNTYGRPQIWNSPGLDLDVANDVPLGLKAPLCSWSTLPEVCTRGRFSHHWDRTQVGSRSEQQGSP